MLELEFLKMLNWKLWVDPQEFDIYLKGLLQHFAQLEPKTQMIPQGDQAQGANALESQFSTFSENREDI